MKPNGMIVWEGPSLLDGAPIVMIATGLRGDSANRKTGAMVQTWILRADVKPMEALKSGRDESICGDCALRGTLGRERICYVNVGQAPTAVWRAYQRGSYPRWDATNRGDFRGRIIRLGSYGDPAAVPVETIEELLSGSKGHTGYTHQWRRCDHRLSHYCMASCDTEQDTRDAAASGWRSFRVRSKRGAAATSSLGGEVLCPASEEAGHKLTCEQCLACCGTASGRRGHIVLGAHGLQHGVDSYERRFAGISIVTEAA